MEGVQADSSKDFVRLSPHYWRPLYSGNTGHCKQQANPNFLQHNPRSCASDIRSWSKLLPPGAVLSGHDYRAGAGRYKEFQGFVLRADVYHHRHRHPHATASTATATTTTTTTPAAEPPAIHTHCFPPCKVKMASRAQCIH